MAETMGDRLRKTREDAFLSQEALAEKAGVQVMTVSRVERGLTSRPYLGTIKKLADALGVDPRWLRDGDGDAPKR